MQRQRSLVAAVLLAGTACLSVALRTRPGSCLFYVLILALPLVWLLGAAAVRPVRRGTGSPAVAVALAIGAWLVFVLGNLLFRTVPWLHHQVGLLLHRADAGALWLTLLVAISNGIAEELFFRGAVYDLLPRRPVLWSTVINVAATAAGGNAALAVAAALMGTVFALQRRATGGILAPVITHVVWSTLVVVALPR